MYAPLRTRLAQPSVCILCAFAVSSSTTCARGYAKAAKSISSLPDKTKGTATKKHRSKKIQNDAESLALVMEAAKAAGAERKRKAQAILNKSTKFIVDASLNVGQVPTLADLDKLEPKEAPMFSLDFIYPDPSHMPLKTKSLSDPAVQEYTTSFDNLVNRIVSRFSKKQLLALRDLSKSSSKLEVRFRRKMHTAGLKTRDIAAEIIRWRWSWPLVPEVLKRQKYLTQMSERGFILSPSELFLLLGTDGSSLRELCEKHGVTLKEVKRVKDGFALIVEGLSHSVDALSVVLGLLKERIRCDVVELKRTSSAPGHAIRADILPKISKLSGALVEDLENGKFRISAYDSSNISTAKRLVIRASQQSCLSPPALAAFCPPLLHSPDETRYALFPFELSKPEKSPFYWSLIQMLTNSLDVKSSGPTGSITDLAKQSLPSQSLYRAQRVSGWLDRPSSCDLGFASGLDGTESQLFELSGKSYTLRQALALPEIGPMSSLTPSKPVTALFGHVVFAPTSGLVRELLPSLQASSNMGNIFDWIKERAKMVTFIPELPSLVTNLSPIRSTLLTRLVYRCSIPGENVAGESVKTLKFEFTSPKVSRSRDSLDLSAELYAADMERGLFSDVESMMSSQDFTVDDGPTIYSTSDTPVIRQLVNIAEGDERSVNIMLLDRPMDMQLSVFDSKQIYLRDAPASLHDYASKLLQWKDWSKQSLRPVPPIHVDFGGSNYTLDWDATVKSSIHAAADGRISDPMEATINSMRDYETKEYLKTCSLICAASNIDTEWHRFLSHCDRISLSKRTFPTSSVYPEHNADLSSTTSTLGKTVDTE